MKLSRVARWFSSRFAMDDRGRNVPLIRLLPLPRFLGSGTPLPREVFWRITSQSAPESLDSKARVRASVSTAVVLVMSNVPFWIWFFVVRPHAAGLRASTWQMAILFACAMALGIPILIAVRRRLFFDYSFRAILKEGYCPSCGYPLKEANVEADGCAVCSECKAAWKAERIVARTLNAEKPRL